jgi:hypothetical protein
MNAPLIPMQVVFHLGAHQTDQGMLLRSLLKNGDLLLAEEVAVPGPSRYRKLIGQMVNSLRGESPDEVAQEALYEALLDIGEPDRLVLSSDSFICAPERAIEEGRLYHRTHKTQWLRALLPGAEAHFAIALRNPATFVPALFTAGRMRGVTYDAFMGGTDPRNLRWSDVIARLVDVNPGCPVTVWCNEDTPLIWGDILHALTGLPDDIVFEGEYDMLGMVMQREGLAELARYLGAHPEASRGDLREVILDLLEGHAAEDRLSVEIDLPGWTQDLVEEITAGYDADLATIRAMPGVRLIEP